MACDAVRRGTGGASGVRSAPAALVRLAANWGREGVARTLAPAELGEQARLLFANGYRLGLVAAHDDGPTLRVVYLFLTGSPDRRGELHVILPADDPRLPSLAEQSFPAARFERAVFSPDILALILRLLHDPLGSYTHRGSSARRSPVNA